MGLLFIFIHVFVGGALANDELPPSVMVEGVVAYPQERNLSCESRSATDMAAFWGATFSEGDFFHRLPRSDNPHRGFLGDVDMPAGSMPPVGYGVYARPLAATLRSLGFDAQAHHAWRLDVLKAELASGRPVVIWATYGMQLPGRETWVSSDGETSVIVRWQHTFIAAGYDEGGIYLIDAYDAETKYFTYDAFMPAWDQLGRMAVTVRGSLVPGRFTPTSSGDGAAVQLLVDGRWVVGPN